MAGDPADDLTPPANGRPARVSDFFFEAKPYQDWHVENWDKRRFYVLNLRRVMQLLRIKHTTLAPHFKRAAELIKQETTWSVQFGEEFTSSPIQAFPQHISERKHFTRAVTIIVAMEAYALSVGSTINVYDYLRVIPAFYFVDRLDQNRLDALRAEYDSWTPEQKKAAFVTAADPHADGRTFDDQCLKYLEQVEGSKLLTELATGACVTKYVAEALVVFLNKHFPPPLHVGPAKPAGDERSFFILGTGDAAPSLLVPQGRDPARLAPPYLGTE